MSLYTVGDLTREYGWLMAFWYNAPVQQLKELLTQVNYPERNRDKNIKLLFELFNLVKFILFYISICLYAQGVHKILNDPFLLFL